MNKTPPLKLPSAKHAPPKPTTKAHRTQSLQASHRRRLPPTPHKFCLPQLSPLGSTELHPLPGHRFLTLSLQVAVNGVARGSRLS
uniref:Uncharacterized protein n=1 Tax=Mycena chlorophos TaxID=658473 RepID=A0ABQ0KWQ6_MYCCL|nr:predicted protein [Mycena chlorophos]